MNLTRRFFLKSGGALAVYSGISPLGLVPGMDQVLAQGGAKPVKRGKTLVVVFLRGGMDGLNFVVPYGDPDYYLLRESIAIDMPGQGDGSGVDLDGFFALHPQALSLQPLFESKLATALHAVGYDKNTRSHFEEQDTWETGTIGNTLNSDGWLNRHLLTSTGHGPIRAVAIGNSMPRILQGNAPAYAIRGLSDIRLPGRQGSSAQLAAALEHAYQADPAELEDPALDLLSQTGRDTLSAVEQLRKVAAKPYRPAQPYPNTGFGNGLQEMARLIKANLGLEVAEINYGGWDTHNNQGGAEGRYGQLVQGLADGLAAFANDLADRMDDVMVLTLSDFGRTARENGTQGTDHGWANCMLAMGGAVRRAALARGTPVLGRWPGLAPDQLNQGRDLRHTTDFRDVLGEVVEVHLGNRHLQTVLPGHVFQPVGLVG